MSLREHTMHECDHMRPVVRESATVWRHVKPNGWLGSRCEAGVYQILVSTEDGHPAVAAVNEEQ